MSFPILVNLPSTDCSEKQTAQRTYVTSGEENSACNEVNFV